MGLLETFKRMIDKTHSFKKQIIFKTYNFWYIIATTIAVIMLWNIQSIKSPPF